MSRKELFFSLRQSIDSELDAIINSGDTNRIDHLVSEVQEHPGYPDRRYRLAHLYYLRGEYDAAIRELDTAVGVNRAFSDALYLKATILANLGKIDEALETHHQILQQHPADAEAYYRMAVLLGRLGRGEEAIGHAKQAIANNSSHERAHLFLAERHLYEHDWQEAIRHYEAVNRMHPHEDHCYVLGLLHLKAEQPEAAEQFFESALELKPNHLNSCVRLAIAKVATGEYERAYGLLRRALGFYPKYPDLHYCLAKVCLLMGKRDEASELMHSALSLNPRYAEVRREMGYLYSVRQMNREAVGELEQSLEINPDDEQAYINLGFIYSNQGEHEQAVQVLEQAIKRLPDSWRLHHSLGVVHLQGYSFPKARVSFLDAISINPELESVQRTLRVVFEDESLLEEERQQLLATYCAPEQKAELDYRLGIIHLDFHKEKPALHFFQRSFEAGYERELNGILLATVYANMQNFDLAVRTLQQIQTSGLSEEMRRILLGLFHANANNYEDSLRVYQEVMAHHPLLFHSLGGLAVCFREAEELDDMLGDYLDYARFYSRTAQLYCRIGEIQALKGSLVEAKKCFHQATILDTNHPHAYHGLGIIAMLRLDFVAASDFFLKAVEKQPEWALPHLNLALLYLAQNRRTLANVSLRRYMNLEQAESYRERARSLVETVREVEHPAAQAELVGASA